MFDELPKNVLLLVAGAFLLGWILASISARMGGGVSARRRDPRDDRIRSLEAEHRVAQSNAASLKEKLEQAEDSLRTTREDIDKRDAVIAHQQDKIDTLRTDLRDSVRKTRELRHELSDRATENMLSEAKARELETELSVAQASTDLLATGVLDYSLGEDSDNDDEQRDGADNRAAS